MATRRSWLKDAWKDLAEACGISFDAGSKLGESALRLVVSVHLASGERCDIGYLRREDGEFVFRYDPGFIRRKDLPPLSEFPRLEQEYRSKTLWAFFASRLPPVERKDIKALLEDEKGRISPKDVLRVLGRVAPRTVASPYELELAGPPSKL
jgi:HipA-like protein